MLIAQRRAGEVAKAFPANMSVANFTFHVVAASVFIDTRSAFRTLFDSHALKTDRISSFPLLTAVVRMALVAFKALAFDFPSLLDFLSLEYVFAVVASFVLILVGLEVFADFDIAHFVKLLLR